MRLLTTSYFFCRAWVEVGTNSTLGKENVTIQNALHKLFDKRKADGSHAKSIMKKVSFDTKTSHLCSAIWFKA
ncbi:hypothetical protein DP116_26755 [Brasilonema bromeliae SPC951]|uniref:Uncharacterized protein n=1 Tax=Brasilonema bromeliae SPC951 TaxID=385972 RepID=A0ABX1PEB5_9CYAN|nr:hypothetical protein [Brasilonema bromeliae SPC951]